MPITTTETARVPEDISGRQRRMVVGGISWRHTFRALPRLVLDYLLLRDEAGRVATASVERLDEHPRDRGATVFGSDHHPLLARIELNHSGAGR